MWHPSDPSDSGSLYQPLQGVASSRYSTREDRLFEPEIGPAEHDEYSLSNIVGQPRANSGGDEPGTSSLPKTIQAGVSFPEEGQGSSTEARDLQVEYGVNGACKVGKLRWLVGDGEVRQRDISYEAAKILDVLQRAANVYFSKAALVHELSESFSLLSAVSQARMALSDIPGHSIISMRNSEDRQVRYMLSTRPFEPLRDIHHFKLTGLTLSCPNRQGKTLEYQMDDKDIIILQTLFDHTDSYVPSADFPNVLPTTYKWLSKRITRLRNKIRDLAFTIEHTPNRVGGGYWIKWE